MTSRSRRVLVAATATALVGVAIYWFAVRDERKPPADQSKTTAELLIGSWKLVQSDLPIAISDDFETICRFLEGGRYEVSLWDFIRGPREEVGTYRVEDNNLTVSLPGLRPNSREIWETTTTIEFPAEDELVLVSVTKIRWSPEFANEIAIARNEPVEPILAQTWEERSRKVFARVR